jgi:hypothetical protein
VRNRIDDDVTVAGSIASLKFRMTIWFWAMSVCAQPVVLQPRLQFSRQMTLAPATPQSTPALQAPQHPQS